jgi:dUTP pyrophosphatase
MIFDERLKVDIGCEDIFATTLDYRKDFDMNYETLIGIKMDEGCDDLFPRKAHLDDAGFDLFAAEDAELLENEIKAISVGFKMGLQPGWEAQVRPRSGLAVKHGIMVVNSPGTIDSGFRGNVKVILKNTGTKASSVGDKFVIKRGDRIAQMVIKQIPMVVLLPVDTISETSRGDGGFGSTGVSEMQVV